MPWNRPLIIGCLVVLVALAWWRLQPQDTELRRSQLMMGTVIEIVAAGDADTLETAVSAAFAELAGSAAFADLMGNANFIELAGSANFMELAGNANFAELAGNANFLELAGNANFAELAGNANFAELAGNANFLELAGNANFAELAGNANFIELAGNSNFAELAGNASFLELAGNAQFAELAGSELPGRVEHLAQIALPVDLALGQHSLSNLVQSLTRKRPQGVDVKVEVKPATVDSVLVDPQALVPVASLEGSVRVGVR